ncbi:MAG TPA: DUF1214 domain-containing protein [Pseudolabrys sp.]|nr:DUF1214 domain-containing protein [Pseudolabrys sp.]
MKIRSTRMLIRGLVVAVMALGGALANVRQADAESLKDQAATTKKYVEEFYPLWFTAIQSHTGSNRLAGPDQISYVYRLVVAINNDTLYASTFLDLSSEPVILTVPATQVRYSVLTLDPYGDIFTSGISTENRGVYALMGPDYSGEYPHTAIPIRLPLDHMIIIFRADKYSSAGKNQENQADRFRSSLLMQPYSEWRKNHSGGATTIYPERDFSVSLKLAADRLIEIQPLTFLKQLQTAVASPIVPPLSAQQQKLSDKFNRLFNASGRKGAAFADGARAGHKAILQNYLTHTDAHNWIDFTNIGKWTSAEALDRSSITEFLQYGNDHDTAAYYHAFTDGQGKALDGSNPLGYVLQIPKGQIPQAQRFWSLTAYTPDTVELIRNGADKYEIASYTPGLHYNADGSLTLYMSATRPQGVTQANWLPVVSGPFNVMLRVYGPEGNVAAGTYVPPAIRKR